MNSFIERVSTENGEEGSITHGMHDACVVGTKRFVWEWNWDARRTVYSVKAAQGSNFKGP